MSQNKKPFSHTAPASKKQIPVILIGTTIAFSLTIIIGMYYHELWRDELEIYSRLAFTNNILLEGDISSVCYYLILKCFMLISNTETMFQIAHLFFIVPAIFLFLKHAKIPNLQKILFVFSFFIIYDYGIISRYYGFMMLLLFATVYLLAKKEKNYLVIVILLLILANHSIQATIFAAAISVYMVLELFHNYLKKKLIIDCRFISVAALFVVGWAVVLASLYYYSLKNSFYFSQGQLISPPLFLNIKCIWNAFIPIPDFHSGVQFWNTNIIPFLHSYRQGFNPSAYSTPPNIFAAAVSIFIICVIMAKFSEKPLVAVAFSLNIMVYLLFLQFLKLYYIRYQGLLFLAFIYNYWLFANAEEHADYKLLQPITAFFKKKYLVFLKKSFAPLVFIILGAQVFSAFYALAKDIKYKFTLSQDAAKYITDNKLNETHVMVGFIDYCAQTIAAHTGTKIYFPQVGHFAYYQEPFNILRKPSMPFTEIVTSITNFTEQENKKVLLILNGPLHGKNNQEFTGGMLSRQTSIKLIQSFTGKIIQDDEQFWLYEAVKVTP